MLFVIPDLQTIYHGVDSSNSQNNKVTLGIGISVLPQSKPVDPVLLVEIHQHGLLQLCLAVVDCNGVVMPAMFHVLDIINNSNGNMS